jgi:hypothetical protein
MTFVYVLIFIHNYTGKMDSILELKEYSTFEACKTAAEMAKTELNSKRYPVATGNYRCLAKPA